MTESSIFRALPAISNKRIIEPNAPEKKPNIADVILLKCIPPTQIISPAISKKNSKPRESLLFLRISSVNTLHLIVVE